MDEPAFGRASATRRRQRPLHTSALFASLRRSARLLRASGASALVGKRPRGEQQEQQQQPSSPLLPPQPSAFMTQQSRPRPPPDHQLSSLPPPTCASLPLASQLPTFSMEHGESPVECDLLQLTGAPQWLPRGHSGGTGSDCLPAAAARPRLAGAAAPPPATAHQPPPRSAGGGRGNKERSCTSSIATEKVFAGPGVLSGVRARLGQEVASLREQGLGGTYRGVMQEMALQMVLREELEYVLPDDAHPRRKPQAADTQLEYAFEALGRAVLAPARLPSRARVLGLADDVMASIGLSVNEFSGAVDWPSL